MTTAKMLTSEAAIARTCSAFLQESCAAAQRRARLQCRTEAVTNARQAPGAHDHISFHRQPLKAHFHLRRLYANPANRTELVPGCGSTHRCISKRQQAGRVCQQAGKCTRIQRSSTKCLVHRVE